MYVSMLAGLLEAKTEGAYEIVFVSDAFVEEELLDSEGCGLERVVDRPERSTGSVAHPRCSVASNTVGLSANARNETKNVRTQ